MTLVIYELTLNVSGLIPEKLVLDKWSCLL